MKRKKTKDREDQRTFLYEGRVIGITTIIDGREEFRPRVNEEEVIEIIRGMYGVERIHLSDNFPGIAMAAHYWGINAGTYIGEVDIAERVLRLGCHDTQELRVADFRTYVLVNQRDLEKEVFPEIKPIEDLDTQEK